MMIKTEAKLKLSELLSAKEDFNSLPNDKFFDWSKLKVYADEKKMLFIFLCGGWRIRVENIVGKGENAGYQHFLLFTQCFQKA